MHKESDALRYGSLEILGAKGPALAYGRFTKNEKVVVVVNNSDKATTLSVVSTIDATDAAF